jgi:hypothetical protein
MWMLVTGRTGFMEKFLRTGVLGQLRNVGGGVGERWQRACGPLVEAA